MKRVRISSSSSMSPVILDYIFKENAKEVFLDDKRACAKVSDKFYTYLRRVLHDVSRSEEMSITNVRRLSNTAYDCQFDAHVVFDCVDRSYDVYQSIRYNTKSGACQFVGNIESKEV